MKCGTCLFKFKGIYYTFGTKFVAVDEFYKARQKSIVHGSVITFVDYREKSKILRCIATTIKGDTTCIYVSTSDIKAIVEPKYINSVSSKREQQLIEEQIKEKETGKMGPLTRKVIDKESKSTKLQSDIEDNFDAWVLYVLVMVVITMYKANVFLWALITLLFGIYKAYDHN